MKKTLTLLFLFFIGSLTILSSCRSPKDLEFRSFQNIQLENLGFSGATLKVDAVYYNPNNFGLELNRTDLDIYLDSSFLGHSSQDLQVKVPRLQEFLIPLKLELDMKNLLKNGIMGLMNKEVLVRAIGKVRVGKAGVYKTFDINYQSMQKLEF